MDKHGNVSQLFNKKFNFKKFTKIPKRIFESSKWSINTLQQKKIQLNNIKAQLGKYNLEEWSRHTKHNDPSSFVIKFLKQRVEPELVTQAWCKFYECLKQFQVIPDFNLMRNIRKYTSLHLCEAPGAFISALNHYIKLNYDNFEWDWIATTLNPDYEGNELGQMIPDNRLSRYTKENWCFGLDSTGDLTKYYNYEHIMNQVCGKVLLVTADGSINCMRDPGNQEIFVEYLFYCETITALSVLDRGGTFVLKIFTIFEQSTICLLYLLNISFDSINAFKPCTSKGGNSELYFVCTGFKGLELLDDIWESLREPYRNGTFNPEFSMFSLDEIPIQFLDCIEMCVDYFMSLQIETITNNIENFRKRDSLFLSSIHHTKVRVANMFLKRYRLKKIPIIYRLVPFEDINSNFYRITNTLEPVCRYNCSDIAGNNLENILCIKYGKKIEKLGFSHFCKTDYFDSINIFRKCFQDHCSLYNLAFIDVSAEYLILNKNDFDCYLYSQFQREFFNFFVCHDLDKDLIILDIPLVTNFLAGFFLLLCSVYEHISVYLNGSIVLSKINPKLKSRFNCIIKSIYSCYENLPQNMPFEVDITEIVSSDLLLYNQLYNIIYNYNNSLLNKIKL
ncbi:hypothetical protein WA026_011700 [Henosepilachna vigintioctopunctata]|uniref:Cap-specific mRNA (nucleoside-2'-O-)-methyltransferase 2 n=1 Tax=Henosepilachna vigintioctopunctata TaxID=420089 RepID=A0AAW1UM18_9CUCU